ncbi:MAG: pirin family protein [Bdellovibrionales bacterium]
MKQPKKTLLKVIQPQGKHWVGDGFHVSTLFSIHSEDYKHISPFLLLDHASPKHFPPSDKKLGVGTHPHRGFETVTFAVQGEVDHRDSGGGGGTITSGGVQWMTAGSGVVHEEFHSRNFAKSGGIFEMVQLWVNLPSKDKMTSPRYQSMNKEDFPQFNLGGSSAMAKLIAGELEGKKGPGKSYSNINMFEIKSTKPESIELNFDSNTNTLIVQLNGISILKDTEIEKGQVGIMSREGSNVELELKENSHLLVLNGEPIDEPVISYGPFVMNTQREIMEAIEDFNSGKMGRLVEEGG